MRAAIEAALAAQMGMQGAANAMGAGAGSSGAQVLGNTGTTANAGTLTNGMGSLPLGSKGIAALTGDGKNDGVFFLELSQFTKLYQTLMTVEPK